MSRLRYALVGAVVFAALAFLVQPAYAVDRRAEAAGKGAIKKAAAQYLAMNYSAAASLLEKASRACGTNRCTPPTKAALLRDLGTMQFRQGDTAGASKYFADALALQPTLALNPDYDAPDLRAAWDAAKGGGSAQPPAEEQPTGDFKHTPASEQTVNTPLPVYVLYPSETPPARVVVKYKGAQMNDWGRLELRRLGKGWGGLIPCAAVTSGPMLYWVQGFDDGGDPIASSGDPKHPYTVPIRDQISAEAPHLPGKPAPRACEEGEREPERPPPTPHERDSETENDNESEAEPDKSEKTKSSGETGYASLWVGFAGALDLLSMPAGDDLCKLAPGTAQPLNSLNLYCTNPDGSDFPSRASSTQNNNLVTKGQLGHLDGGFQPGNVRIMLALDYALSPSWLVGGRFGYVANAYTGNAAVNDGRAFGAKFHIEARVTYLLGHAPLAHPGFAPMAFLSGGASEFDGHSTSVVTIKGIAGQQPVDIWVTNGPAFVALGAGARYQFSLRAAFTVALRLNGAFGGNGALVTYGPEVGVQYGF
jgi:hypothetical protein